jgi:hypothetical protein
MVRTYIRKFPGRKWTDEGIDRAVSSVIRGDVSLRGAAGLFHVPYSKLKDRVNFTKMHNALGKQVITKSAGLPTVFNVEEENHLAARLKYLARRDFGCTPDQIRGAAFVFANNRGISHPWDKEEMSANNDWFTGFMKRNDDIALRKPEGLSKARVQGMNKKAVEGYFVLYQNLCTELHIHEKPKLIFNMDETGFPLNNIPPKIVATKGAREDVNFTDVKRGENVTVVACCSESGVFIPPFVIFKGFRNIYKQVLPVGSEVAITDSGYINEDIFLEWLQHFQKHRSPGKCLLVLDGHGSHSSLNCLDYCRDNGIEMLCLPPHTTHVLQPLDRTVFKPIKTYYHQAATNFMHNHPKAAITKFNF